jgi:alpha-glucoside transport system permease protein
MSAGSKFLDMFIAIFAFIAVMGVVLFLADRVRSRRGELIQTVVFVLPAAALIAVGLLYPGIRTIFESFRDQASREFVGIDNYKTIFTNSDQLTVLRNTAVWVILTPILATFIGLVYAVLIDKARIEAVAKALIFLPMAISLVGASLIWKFVYDYRATENEQIGLANAILKAVGLDTYRFLLTEPWNTIFLIVIMIWVQAGFAMTVLSASI